MFYSQDKTITKNRTSFELIDVFFVLIKLISTADESELDTGDFLMK